MQTMSFSLDSTINLDQLRAFVLVARAGSFTAAAASLDLTQPAVSLQVRQLERRLGVRLLERVGRRVKPTAAGVELLVHAPRIAGAVDAAVDAVRSHSEGVSGRVHLATSVTNCLYLLPPVLRRLRDEFPSLAIVVSAGNVDEVMAKVEGNQVDLAVVTLPAPSRSVSLTPLFKGEFVAIRRRGAAADWPARLTPRVLHPLPQVKFSAGTSTQGIVDAWLRQAGRAREPAMQLDSAEAIKEVVAAGLGYAILPRMSVTGRGHHPDLEVRQLSPRLYGTQAIAMRGDKPMTRALRKVFDAIVEEAKESKRVV